METAHTPLAGGEAAEILAHAAPKEDEAKGPRKRSGHISPPYADGSGAAASVDDGVSSERSKKLEEDVAWLRLRLRETNLATAGLLSALRDVALLDACPKGAHANVDAAVFLRFFALHRTSVLAKAVMEYHASAPSSDVGQRASKKLTLTEMKKNLEEMISREVKKGNRPQDYLGKMQALLAEVNKRLSAGSSATAHHSSKKDASQSYDVGDKMSNACVMVVPDGSVGKNVNGIGAATDSGHIAPAVSIGATNANAAALEAGHKRKNVRFADTTDFAPRKKTGDEQHQLPLPDPMVPLTEMSKNLEASLVKNYRAHMSMGELQSHLTIVNKQLSVGPSATTAHHSSKDDASTSSAIGSKLSNVCAMAVPLPSAGKNVNEVDSGHFAPAVNTGAASANAAALEVGHDRKKVTSAATGHEQRISNPIKLNVPQPPLPDPKVTDIRKILLNCHSLSVKDVDRVLEVQHLLAKGETLKTKDNASLSSVDGDKLLTVSHGIAVVNESQGSTIRTENEPVNNAYAGHIGVVIAGATALEARHQTKNVASGASTNFAPKNKKIEKTGRGQYFRSPAALVLDFTQNTVDVPSKEELVSTFCRFGILIESQTDISIDTRRARIVFGISSEATSAYSWAPKLGVFGPPFATWRIEYLPPIKLNEPQPPPPAPDEPLTNMRKNLEKMVSSMIRSPSFRNDEEHKVVGELLDILNKLDKMPTAHDH